MNLSIQSNLSQFNSALARYLAAHQGRKSVDDLMEKKGRDIGIRLYRGFSARKWGGAGQRPRDLARRELDARVVQGRGIRLRSAIMRDYLAARSTLRAKQQGKELTGARIEARTSLWRRFVGRELAARQRGIGVLAASFLWYRTRSSHARGTFYVRNRSRQVIGGVDRDENTFRIHADTPGLEVVNARHQIVATALADATADIEEYFRERPEYWQFWNTANSMPAA